MKTNNSLKRSTAEKISFSISLFVLSTVIALLIFSWINGENSRPPVLELSVSTEIRQVNEQYYVPFKVTNTGGQTAESIEIIAELKREGEREFGTQQIEYLSRGEIQEGAFVFLNNPRQAQLQIRVSGFKLP